MTEPIDLDAPTRARLATILRAVSPGLAPSDDALRAVAFGAWLGARTDVASTLDLERHAAAFEALVAQWRGAVATLAPATPAAEAAPESALGPAAPATEAALAPELSTLLEKIADGDHVDAQIQRLQELRAEAPRRFDAASAALAGEPAPPAPAPIPEHALFPAPEVWQRDASGVPFLANVTWTNHQASQRVAVERLYRPESLADVRAIIAEALRQGRAVRAFGSGHAYSDVATTRGYLIDTSALGRTLPLPALRVGASPFDYAHVEAGMKLRALNAALHKEGRALLNLGGYTGQSVIGAASTGTHGSGIELGNIASSIASLVVATERGVFRVEPADGPTDASRYREPGVDGLIQDDRHFRALAVSMGCMGVVYSVIVRVRPRYQLREARTLARWSDVRPLLASRELFRRSPTELHRHVEVWVNPHVTNGDRTVLVTTRNEHEGTPQGGDLTRNFVPSLLERLRFTSDATALLVNACPQATPGFIDSTLRSLVDAGYVSWSHEVLASDEAMDGWACEVALSMRDAGYLDAIDEMFAIAQRQAAEHRRYMSLLSLRFVRASDAFLAPQHAEDGAPTCMVEVPTLAKVRGSREVFRAVTQAALARGGRAHWGLEFDDTRGLDAVRRSYPRFGDWHEVYKGLNPKGTFANAFTARIGISGAP